MIGLTKFLKFIHEITKKRGFQHQVRFDEVGMTIYLNAGGLSGGCSFTYLELDRAVGPMSFLSNRLELTLNKIEGIRKPA